MVLTDILIDHIHKQGYYITRIPRGTNTQLGIYYHYKWLGIINVNHEQITVNILYGITTTTTTIHHSDPELLATIDQLITTAAAKWSSQKS